MKTYTEKELWISTPTCRTAFILEHFSEAIEERLKLALAYSKLPSHISVMPGVIQIKETEDALVAIIRAAGPTAIADIRLAGVELPPAGTYILSNVTEDSAEFLPVSLEKPFPDVSPVPSDNCKSGSIRLGGPNGRGSYLSNMAREVPGIIDILAVNGLYDGMWRWTMNDNRSPLIMTCDETGDVVRIMPFVMNT